MIAIFPEIAAAALAGDVERLAILVRRYFCDREAHAPNPDVARLMINAGMEVKTLPMDTLGALLAKDERGAFNITCVVHERTEEPAKRFLLAHMLGHYLLEIQPLIARGDWQISGYREAHCPAKRYAQAAPGSAGANLEQRREIAADEFAAALLLPRGMVRRAMDHLKDLDKTAAFFNVTLAVLCRRLGDIGIMQPGPTNFLDAERQLGGEPLAEAEPAPTLNAPIEPSMPRSYAASTYGQTEKATRQPVAKAPAPAVKGGARPAAKPTAKPAPKATAEPVGQGMDRLRAIARRMDKGSAG